MTVMVSDFRDLYNHVRPTSTSTAIGPLQRYLSDPAITPSDAEPATTMRIP